MIQRPKNDPWNEDNGFLCRKKFRTLKSLSKVLSSVFWDKDGILLVDYLEKGATTTAKYCIAFLDKLKQQVVFKH
jgi:hypothetical protein